MRAFARSSATSDLDRDFEEELQSHVAMLTEDNVRRGMAPEAARRAALIRVGGAASLHERHREARGLPAFDTLLHDLRFASRLLIKDRWFTAAVVVALALGMGVNTTVFTVINGWNLRDLPVDEPGRLMHLGTRDAQGRTRGVSYLDFLDWRDGSRTFTGLAAYADTQHESRGGGPSRRSSGRLLRLRATRSASFASIRSWGATSGRRTIDRARPR